MINNNPSITIVTVTYNCGKTIEKTIQSVLSQKKINIEFIIVDGDSNDETKNIINKYEDKIDIFLSEKDRGIAEAMNKGIKLATGNILTFLNSGDFYVDHYVLHKVHEWWINEKWLWAYGFPKLMINNQKTNFKIKYSKFSKHQFLYKTPNNHQCTFFSSKVFKTHGLYKINDDHLMDIDFFLRLVFANIKPSVKEFYVVWYDTMGHSTKNLNLKNYYGRINLIKKYTSGIKFIYYLILITIFFLKRLFLKIIKKLYSKIIIAN